MAKANMLQREQKRKVLSAKYKEKRLKIKKLIKQAATFEQKLDLQEKLQKLPKDSAQCRVRNRCCLLYTSPSPRDLSTSRMPSSA